ncbi:uncharacterized protein LOC129575427 [Sitodiplosis mosellana]|uniref:uncharacterized protein LOC129575427 n=1 Tax=Sitodiplosis mosellana TaxID=263140 RepID=UPI00244472B7|nr:uncharacterized protein LOC129575427 [Sitodiplosis mosellana]
MVLKFAFKVVIASTAVYWTNQLEVWSQLSRKERAYDKLIACAKAYIAKNTPDSLKLKVQKVQDDKLLLCATTNYYYNQGVISTFEALSNLPKTVGGLYDQAVAKLNSAAQTPDTKPAK